MSDRWVAYQVKDGVAEIVLDRPDAANAIDLTLAHAFAAAAGEACDDTAVRAVLVRGAGDRLCVGGDLASMHGHADRPALLLELAEEFGAGVVNLVSSNKPVVTVAHGAVAGAGLALVLGADLTVAARETRFAFGYTGVGLTPDCGVSWLLPRVVGHARAHYFALSGKTLTAPEAATWGIVGTVTETPESALREGRNMAARLAAWPAYALSHTKRLFRESEYHSLDETVAHEARQIALAVETDDAKRLISEFLTPRRNHPQEEP